MKLRQTVSAYIAVVLSAKYYATINDPLVVMASTEDNSIKFKDTLRELSSVHDESDVAQDSSFAFRTSTGTNCATVSSPCRA